METSLIREGDGWRGTFAAMASDCELIFNADGNDAAWRVMHAAVAETRRIEQKFSRYRTDNIIYRINEGTGTAVDVDDETADLIDFAQRCYDLSAGAFDITSGVLRRVWRFDGSDNLPRDEDVAAVQRLVGWHLVRWERPRLVLPEGMEIDLGGIGKEYAVDRVAERLVSMTAGGGLVNFGGDLRATGPRADGRGWTVGIEDAIGARPAAGGIDLRVGSLATSGDARRYLEKAGKRYSHVLDPRTGYPVEGAPRSVTVLADTCVEAGMLATMAMLRGPDAESFLAGQGVRHWCIRGPATRGESETSR